MQEFINYYSVIKSYDLSKITEHSLRPALNELLVSIANELNPNIKVVHEAKREGKFGAPDFKIFETENIIGYVENKKIEENLDKILKSDQIKKYKELSNNLLITNYLEWIWIRNGEVQQRETLCFISDFENKKSKLNTDKAKSVKTLITNYLSTAPQGIADSKKLAEALAIRAKLLKEFIFEALEQQEKSEEQPKLKGLYHTFKDFVFSELTVSEFSDAFAQTLTYGLFLAKLNADTKQVNLYNVSQFIPVSFQLIRELVDFLKELENPDYKEIRWVVEEIITIMNTLDLRAIQENLSFSNRKKSEIAIKDPYVYFYEDFLAAYDKSLRKAKGVYYTPPPVVNFIVKSTNEILKNDFNIKSGLADEKRVTILDFATGTGTFLVEIFQNIFETIANSGKKNLIIQEHLLKNIYGFEYLIAPYTITHLKLSQFLKEHQYELSDKERFQVFLTNTLEPIDKQIRIPLMPALTKESKDAQEIKDKPVLVITGNPPYSITSSNKNDTILKLLTYYKEGLNEKSLNSLSDDYIKFIRFAHDKINKSGNGVIAIITNNSYLSGTVHRRMRETLYNDFDKIYILNLHGNSLRKEKGENVFDIRVGVSILFLVKNFPKVSNIREVEKQVFYYSTQATEIFGREDKFNFLLNNNITTVNWIEIKPQNPDFWFVEKDLSYETEYNKFWSLKNIFKKYGIGFSTDKDNLFIDNDKEILKKRIEKMFSLNFENDFAKKYKIENTERYKLIDKIKSKKFNENSIKLINYRIFDKKYCFYEKGITSRPVPEIMKHLDTDKNNIALITTRMLSSDNFTHAQITDRITERCYISNRGSEANYIFPLYLYEDIGIFKEISVKENEKLLLKFEKEKRIFKQKDDEFKAINPNDKEKLLEQIYEEEKTLKEAKKLYFAYNENITGLKQAEKTNASNVRTTNFTPTFLEYLSNKYENEYSPEQILGYIYAILYSPFYRSKYSGFLKNDFPKIPFVDDENMFIKLSKIGTDLIDLHTFENISDCKYGNFIGAGNCIVNKISYTDNKLFINEKQYFENTPENVFNFTIGNYKIIERYLKDRKDKKLELDEINTLEDIIKSLYFTIEKMNVLEDLTKNII